MVLDSVVIGSIASVVLAIVVVGVISYKIVKQIDDKNKED